MEAVVTGGTGFIAKVLVKALLEEGEKVIVLTRNKAMAESLLPKATEIYEAEISNLTTLERISLKPRENKRVIFHLASSLDYFGGKKRLFKINVRGTSNLLLWAKRNGIERFIFTSSVEAMGPVDESEIPADESFSCKPVSSYGQSKLQAEREIMRFIDNKNFESVILRLGNVYGPGSPSFIIPIAQDILNKKGKLLRFLPTYKERHLHLIYIDDVVKGLIKASQEGKGVRTYILAGAEHTTLGYLFELIAQALELDIEIGREEWIDEHYLNLRTKALKTIRKADLLAYFMSGQGKRIHRAYSIKKVKEELGFYPMVSLTEGISRTIEWAKEERLL